MSGTRHLDVEGALDDVDIDGLRGMISDDEDEESIDRFEDDFEEEDDLEDDEPENDVAEDEDEDVDVDANGAEHGNRAPEADHEDVQFDFSDEDADYDPNEDDNLMDDEFEFKNMLREANNMKPKRRKGTGGYRAVTRQEKVSPEVRALLSQANEDFVRGDFQVALQGYLEVVRTDPKNFSAYKTIGEIYNSQGKVAKCCNFWIIAAHLHPWDSEFWTTVGDISFDLGHTRQALYCYTRAVQSSKDKKNLETIFKRAVLLRETGHYTKAADSFLKLLKLQPDDANCLKELAVVYVNQNRITEAIDTYLAVFEQNMNHRKALATNPHAVLGTVEFGWSELNILTELYAKQTAWTLGYKMIKVISRWIHHREKQTWWNEYQDDSEFDSRRFENPRFAALPLSEQQLSHDLPIDIRVQLGLFRLNSGSNDEALSHFDYLLRSHTDENADLFFEVGKALEEKMMYAAALKFFVSLTHVEDYNTFDLIFSVGKCLFNAHLNAEAKEAFEACLKSDPDNIDVLTILIEIGIALEDSNYVDDMTERFYRAQERAAHDLDIPDDDVDAGRDGDAKMSEDAALIQDIPRDPSKQRRFAKSDQEWYQKDQALTIFVTEGFKRAERMYPAAKHGEKFANDIWMMTVTSLVELFVSARGFFQGEKCEALKKLLADNRTSEPNLTRRIARINRVREQKDLDRRQKASEPVGDFRGKSFQEWFDLVMEYCLTLAHKGDENAFVVLDACQNATCFSGEDVERLIALAGIALSAQFDDSEKLTHYTRLCLFQNQFSSIAAKMFILIHKGSNEISDENHSSQQKFFLRQIKAFDSLKQKKKISGMANIYVRDVDVTHEHPVLNYVYAGLLLSSKSYISHLAYIQKLVDDGWRNDPMLYFCLGIGHLHRAMNRLANNRNLEILQGIAYLLKYTEVRLSSASHTERDVQETEYNLGRAFHMLGLATLATEQYKKVLARKLGFLEAEASYNMYLLLNIYGTGEGVELMTV